MQKIAIGWLGINKDFLSETEVNPNGPTLNFLLHHWQYSEYILLFTEDNLGRAAVFERYVKENHPQIRIKKQIVSGIEKVHQDLDVIKALVEKILLGYRNYEIDIFLSTGSGTMKIAWYILHTTLKLHTRLVQILPPEESRDPRKPDLVEVQTQGVSPVPVSAIIREQVIGQSRKKPFITASLREVYDKAEKIAVASDVPVLILGSTGTGKELLARHIHCASPRRRKPFRAVNTAAMSDQLLESRLFGYKKGCFTGAHKDFKGIFEQADGGTVFLDEIGDISPYMQQALLRLLQEKEIQPLCGEARKVNVRIIAATNRNIYDLVEQGRFRADLFFRLGIMLHLPDFKDYTVDEKRRFIEYLLKEKQKLYGRQYPEPDKQLWDFLLTYHYPGNIRELENILDYIFVLSENDRATIDNLPPYIKTISSGLSLKEVERRHIEKVLRIFNYNKMQTARALGIAVNTLKNKIREYEIKVPDKGLSDR